MKFNCKKPETWDDLKARMGRWHLKFAWFPVRVGENDCRWLEFVARRGQYQCYYDNDPLHYWCEWRWEYRPL